MSTKFKRNINIKFDFEQSLTPHQILVINDDSRFIDVMAGRRGGKDHVGIRKFLKNIYTRDLGSDREYDSPNMNLNLPRLYYWVVAPTYSLTKVLTRHLLRCLTSPLIQKNRLNSSPPFIWLYPDILIEFKTAENPNMLVGEGLHGVYITETARLKRAAWNDNIRPALSEFQGWGIFTTTPLGHNWYIEEIRSLAEDPENEDYSGHYWTTADNTKMPGLLKEVETARKTMPKKYFDRNYLASPDAFHGQIYDEFRRDVHVQSFDYDPNRYFCLVGGIDWGYTHHAGFVIVGITHDGHVDILEEYSVSGKQTEEWMQEAKHRQTKYGDLFQMFYAGPDQPEHIEMFRANGIRIKPANNNVSAGIQTVAMLMKIDKNGKSRYRSHTSCTRLNKYKPAYTWIVDKETDGSTEKPKKIDDDEQDMERYAIHTAWKSQLFQLAELEALESEV